MRLDDSVLCRVLGRYKMYVDFRDYGLAPHLMMDGYWEMPVTEAIIRFVGSGMSVIDAGANHGYFTLLMADLVGGTGHVFAAEPNPRMMSLLEKSIEINGFRSRVTSVTEALSSESGHTITLHVPQDFPQNASIKWNGNDQSEGHGTTTLTIDELIGDRNVDFIKIDVEGAEEDVWKGMSSLIGRKKPLAILLEFTPNRYVDAEAFLRSIMDEGFALAQVTPTKGVQATSVQDVLEGPVDQDRMLILAR
ncbi:MAG: FkbM family methyltransferase [Janthinobacterium lividum]